MTYWRLFFHVVWGTKNRESLIRSSIDEPIHRCLVDKATELGAIVHAVGGAEDHVHMVVSVPPGIALATFVGQLKGSSSHFANHVLLPPGSFAWQAEYGIISLDGERLDGTVGYVRNQRQHHTAGTTIPLMEQSTSDASNVETKC